MDICNSGPDGSAAYKVVAIPQETGLSLMKYNKISESGMQKMKDEADMLCRLCRGLRSKAVKVCHHSDCQEQNGHKPLMLCAECDKTLHESGSHEGHLRFDLPHRAKVFTSGFPHDLSSHSLPAEVTYLEEEEGEDEPDTPVTSVQRNGQGARQVSAGTSKLQEGSTNGQSSVDIEDEGGGRISYERKGSLDSRNMGDQSQQSYGSLPRIKRKKVVKKKFHNNEKLDYADPPQELSKAKQSETLHPLKFALHSLVANSSQFALEMSSNLASSRSKSLGAEDFLKHAVQGDEGFNYKIPKKPASLRQRSRGGKSKDWDKKHSISRDCFTLKFDMFEELDIEIVTAVAGVTLRDALLPLCEKRAIIVDKLNVFIDASHTPLKLEFDTFHLGGTQLTVKAKDGDSPFIPRSSIPTKLASKTRSLDKARDKVKPGGNQKARKISVISPGEELAPGTDSQINSSPNNTLTAADGQKLRGRTGGRLSSILNTFGLKETNKQELLSEKLNEYSLTGLPDMPELLTLGHPKFDQQLFELEGHWTAFVDDPGSLSKKQKDQQEALWELLHTEVEYIRKLKVITDLFMCVLINLQNEQLLNEIETEKLFSNISEIALANSQFWCGHMSRVLEEARRSRKPMNPGVMKDGFVKHFEEEFLPYTKYCLEHKMCQDYMKTCFRENELFRTFVVWAEAQKQCNRLKLNDLLVKPMQRLTKYSLLLSAILKKTEDEETRKDLKEMVQAVDKFVHSVDSSLRHRHEQERLAAIINRIEAYEGVDPPNEECVKTLQEYSNFTLTCPMPGCLPQQTRHLLLERPLKMKEATGKMDVHCFLFTDMLLVTKPTKRGGTGDRVKIVKPPMRIDKVVVQELRDGGSFLLIYLNEYHVASAALTMQTDNVKLWINKIQKAQELYKKARDEATEKAERQLAVNFFDIDDDDEADYYGTLLSVDNGSMRSNTSHESLTRQYSEDNEGKYLPNLVVGPVGGMYLPHAHSELSLDQIEMISNTGADPCTRIKDSRKDRKQRPRSLTYGDLMMSPSLAAGRQDEEAMRFLFPDESASMRNSPKVSPTAVRRRGHVTNKPGPIIIKPYRADSFSGSETNSPHGQMSPMEKKQFALPDRPSIAFNLDESLRGKLNQRRQGRGEKRYHTADSIQDINRSHEHDKDASIHKRLSWHLGTVDINLEDREAMLKNKAFSSESLRSIRSSSGVSSTGSLHLSPESEISEEYEQDGILTSSNEQVKPKRSESDSKMRPDLKDLRSRSNAVELETNGSTSNQKLNSNSKSKSLSDISRIIAEASSSEMKDGISSVDLPKYEGQKKKLSHAEIMKMKKQLLLSSNVEASEV